MTSLLNMLKLIKTGLRFGQPPRLPIMLFQKVFQINFQMVLLNAFKAFKCFFWCPGAPKLSKLSRLSLQSGDWGDPGDPGRPHSHGYHMENSRGCRGGRGHLDDLCDLCLCKAVPYWRSLDRVKLHLSQGCNGQGGLHDSFWSTLSMTYDFLPFDFQLAGCDVPCQKRPKTMRWGTSHATVHALGSVVALDRRSQAEGSTLHAHGKLTLSNTVNMRKDRSHPKSHPSAPSAAMWRELECSSALLARGTSLLVRTSRSLKTWTLPHDMGWHGMTWDDTRLQFGVEMGKSMGSPSSLQVIGLARSVGFLHEDPRGLPTNWSGTFWLLEARRRNDVFLRSSNNDMYMADQA